MALFVNTNVSSLHGRNNLNRVNNALDSTYQRLSSGLRINSARDDAAGLQIADRMTSQINGLSQANRNASDAIALMQTMEGGISEISNSLQQVRTLLVQASNGTNTAEDKKSIADNITQLLNGITDTATTTKFGGKTILNGAQKTGDNSIFVTEDNSNAEGTITFQIGANSGDTFSLTLKGFAVSAGTLGGAGGVGKASALLSISDWLKDRAADGELKALSTNAADTDAIGEMIKDIDTAIGAVDAERANLGASMNRLESTIRSQSNTIANQSDARSRIRDTDFAEESANLSQQNIIQQAATSMLMQANARPQLALSLLG